MSLLFLKMKVLLILLDPVQKRDVGIKVPKIRQQSKFFYTYNSNIKMKITVPVYLFEFMN